MDRQDAHWPDKMAGREARFLSGLFILPRRTPPPWMDHFERWFPISTASDFTCRPIFRLPLRFSLPILAALILQTATAPWSSEW